MNWRTNTMSSAMSYHTTWHDENSEIVADGRLWEYNTGNHEVEVEVDCARINALTVKDATGLYLLCIESGNDVTMAKNAARMLSLDDGRGDYEYEQKKDKKAMETTGVHDMAFPHNNMSGAGDAIKKLQDEARERVGGTDE